jgi:RimJ/RimL family protein N-acetyltransferase
MKTVIYGKDLEVRKWVAERVGEDDFEDGVAIGLEEDGEIIAGVVYTMFTQAGVTAHIAAVPGRRWMTRDFLWRIFAYPFIQLKCNRISGLVRADNLEAQKFDEHLGFKREGLLRRACTDGTDMILYGMLREECRFLGDRYAV